MTKLPIVVAGLRRSGASMCMQVLNHAGIPCVGSAPRFAPDFGPATCVVQTARDLHGAVLVLDPTEEIDRNAFAPTLVIWCSCSYYETAASQAKIRKLHGTPGRRQASLAADAPIGRRALMHAGATVLMTVRFEDAFSNPGKYGNTIERAAVYAGHTLAAPIRDAVREVVAHRHPCCFDGEFRGHL